MSRLALVFVSAPGPEPGLAAHGCALPLVADSCFATTRTAPSSPLHEDTPGVHDPDSTAPARLAPPPGPPPGPPPTLAGASLHRPSAVASPLGEPAFAGNPRPLVLAP